MKNKNLTLTFSTEKMDQEMDELKKLIKKINDAPRVVSPFIQVQDAISNNCEAIVNCNPDILRFICNDRSHGVPTYSAVMNRFSETIANNDIRDNIEDLYKLLSVKSEIVPPELQGRIMQSYIAELAFNHTFDIASQMLSDL